MGWGLEQKAKGSRAVGRVVNQSGEMEYVSEIRVDIPSKFFNIPFCGTDGFSWQSSRLSFLELSHFLFPLHSPFLLLPDFFSFF